MMVVRASRLASPLLLLFAARPIHAQSARAGGGADAREIVRTARRAVEGDSVAALRVRWQHVLQHDSTDRGAALGLAALARFTYRHDDADRRFRALFAAHGTTPDAISTAALLGAAFNLDEIGTVDRTDSLFVHARAEAHARHDRASEAEALAGLSLIRASQFGQPLGVALLDTATRLVPAGEDEVIAGIAYRHSLLAAVAQTPTAGAEALAGAAVARRAGAPRLEALCLRSLALDEKLRERFDSSLHVLEQAESLQRAAHDDGQLAVTLARHADIYHIRGDLGSFRQYVLAGRQAAQASGNTYVMASSDVGLALIAIQLHDDPTAAHYLAQAQALDESTSDRGGLAQVKGFTALLAADMGDFSRARTLQEAALAFRHSTSDPEEFEVSRDLVYMDIGAGDLAAARDALRGAEDAARRYHLLATTNFDRERGRLALATGDFPLAIRTLTRAVQRNDTSDHVLRYGSRVLLAEAYAEAGQLPHAADELSSAEDELDAWRATLTDSALRPFVFQVSSQEIDAREIGPAVVVAAMVRGGLAGEAFVLAERRRARELADRLLTLEALRSTPPGTATPGSPAADPRRAATLTSRRLSADSVAAVLPARTAFLEFVTGAHGAPTILFAIARPPASATGSSLHAFVLPSADSLNAEIARLLALLESGEEAGPLEHTLGVALLDSALTALGPGVSRLIIVPDGPLHRLPFDALETADRSFVAAQFAVTIAPSAEVWDAIRRRSPAQPRDAGGLRLLAMANPEFAPVAAPGLVAPVATRDSAEPIAGTSGASGDMTDVYRGAFDSAGGLPQLPASVREARIVAAFAPRSEIRTGSDATAAYLEHAPLADFAVIHIATHALVDERSIARTALALAPSPGVSGFLSPSDLEALHLSANLVVLSACRTAGGVVIDGEGVQGLTGPFLAAGAHSVLATQWRVKDNAVLPIVEDFYSALAAGQAVGDALQTAKRAAIRRRTPTAEWAAFTIVGDPMTRVALIQPGPIRLAVTRAGGPVAVTLAGLAAIVLLVIAWMGTRLSRPPDAV